MLIFKFDRVSVTDLNVQALGQPHPHPIATQPQPLALGDHVLNFPRVEVDKRHTADLVAADLGIDLRLADGIIDLGQDVLLQSDQRRVQGNSPALGAEDGRLIALKHGE